MGSVVMQLAESRAREALLLADYRRLLGVLAAVVAGEVRPEGVTVDLTNDRWSVNAPQHITEEN